MLERYNLAVDGRMNFDLGDNHRHGARRVWYNFRSVGQINRK